MIVQVVGIQDIDQSFFITPPDDWENKTIPKGKEPFYIDYQFFKDDIHIPGNPLERVLYWYRVYFWIPKGVFCRMTLQPDNTWKDTGPDVIGPVQYLEIGVKNGTHTVHKLMAE